MTAATNSHRPWATQTLGYPTKGTIHCASPRMFVLVQVHRNAELGAHPLAETPCDRGAVLDGGTLHRDERADVGCAHARVLAAMGGHIDDLGGGGDGGEGRILDRSRLTDEGHHGAVRGLSGVDVEQRHPIDGLDRGSDCSDSRRIATR